MDAILNRIEKVTISEWTGDMYLTPSDVLGTMATGVPGIIFCHELATEDLYEAINAMIADWTYTELENIGCSEYTRPATEAAAPGDPAGE